VKLWTGGGARGN